MKNRQEIISKIAYYSFYLGVILEVLIVLIDKSSFTNPIEGRLFQITFLLFFIKLCLTKYSKKEYFIIALFLGLGATSYFATERNEIVRFATFVAACKGIDMTQCMKRVFYLTMAGCGAIILLSVTGICGAVSLTQDYGRGMVETRYVLGMGHPNALQCMIWALTVLGIYLYGEKLKCHGYVLLLVTNVGFFLLTDSKTSLIGALFAIAYAGLHRCNVIHKKQVIDTFGIAATIGSIAISVLIAGNAYHVYNYDWNIDRSLIPTLMKKIDGPLTGRIRSLTSSIRWEGTTKTWSLFSAPENSYYFDMGWIRLFYWYGVIPALIVVSVLIIWMLYSYQKKQYMSLFLIVSFAIYTVFEAHAVSVYLARNYLLFAFGAVWSQLLQRSSWKKEADV